MNIGKINTMINNTKEIKTLKTYIRFSLLIKKSYSKENIVQDKYVTAKPPTNYPYSK